MAQTAASDGPVVQGRDLETSGEPYFSPGTVQLNLSMDKHMRTNFEEFLSTEVHSDVDIFCRDKCIKAHKVILAAGSGYFKRVLTSQIGTITKLTIDVEPSLFSICLTSIYTGSVEVSPSRLGDLKHLARYLDVQQLYHACRAAEMRDEEAVPDNCLAMMCTARAVGDDALILKCKPVALANFVDLTSHESFFDLCNECMHELLTDENLRLSAAEQRLNALLAWVNHDLCARQEALHGMFTSLHIGEMNPWVLEALVHHTALQGQEECQAILKEAMSSHKKGQRIEAKPKVEGEAGDSDDRQCLLVVGRRAWVAIGSKPTNDALLLADLPLTGRCQELTILPTEAPLHSFLACCVSGNMIYLSGLDPLKNKCWRFCMKRREWYKCGALNVSRRDHCMAASEGRVFTIGGRGLSDASAVKQVEVYNEKSHSWQIAGEVMGEFCYNTCCCVYEGQIIVHGVINSSWKPLLQVFSPTHLNVSHYLTLPSTNTVHGVAVAYDEVIVAGYPYTYSIPVASLLKSDSTKLTRCSNYPSPKNCCVMTLYHEDVLLYGGDPANAGSYETAYKASAKDIIKNHNPGWEKIKVTGMLGEIKTRPGSCSVIPLPTK